jgi:hypothetical protein
MVSIMKKEIIEVPDGFWFVREDNGLVNIAYSKEKIEPVQEGEKFVGYRVKND